MEASTIQQHNFMLILWNIISHNFCWNKESLSIDIQVITSVIPPQSFWNYLCTDPSGFLETTRNCNNLLLNWFTFLTRISNCVLPQITHLRICFQTLKKNFIWTDKTKIRSSKCWIVISIIKSRLIDNKTTHRLRNN